MGVCHRRRPLVSERAAADDPARSSGTPLQGIVSRASRWAPVWAPLLLLIAATYLQMARPPLLQALSEAVFDGYLRLKPRADDELNALVVDIDEESIRRIGQWPWPRWRVGEIVERLRAAGVAAIAFDTIFGEPDRTSPRRLLDNLAVAPQERGELERQLSVLPDHDAQFAQAIAGGGVVLGFVLTGQSGGGFPPLKAIVRVQGGDVVAYAPRWQGAINPLPELAKAAAGLGSINSRHGESDVLRRTLAVVRADGQLLPSLSVEALRVATGARQILVRAQPDGKGVGSVEVSGVEIPTTREGEVWINFSDFTKERAQRYIPAWKVLAGEPIDVAGRIVFVGSSAAALSDIRKSPLGLVPGVELHAQVVEQAISGAHLIRPGWAPLVELAGTLLVSLAAVALNSRAGAVWSGLAGFLGAGVAVAGSWAAFATLGLVLDPLFPAVTIVATYLLASLLRRLQTERAERFVREAFSSYVSPNLVKHLIENPDALKLGGERRECSFVTTDLAGFTGLVERSQPAQVVALLNEYLGQMTAIAFRHEGTLDKIVGDAVAVLFGAPTPQPDHARRAVACALEMDAFARDFATAKQAAGLSLGRTRIGVNSGTVIVGNVGGGGMFDYRALGDMINTASRLETANRMLGTRISVAAATAAQVPDFVGRPVGRLVLKGKSEPIAVLNALHPEEDRADNVAAYRAAYALMEAGDPAAPASFEAAAAAHPDDALIAFQLARLQAGERGSLIVMTEK